MKARKQAVVIGGSMAGQLAAAALSQAGFQVTILDRDELPGKAAPRKGLPQGRHIHALLVGGQRAIEELLPGLSAQLVQSGAHVLDIVRDIAVHTLAGWYRRDGSGLQAYFMSRDLIDHEVRNAAAKLPGVRTLCSCEALGLLGDTTAVRGMRYRRRGEDGEEISVEADLVVDASGRDSKAPAWLASLGCGNVRESVVDAFLGYATRLYRVPDGFDPGWAAIIARSRDHLTRAGGIVPIEGGRWLATLAGFARDYPPHTGEGFVEFARSLGVTELARALEAAEPIGEPVGYRRTTNRWRRYDAMRDWPEGFVALGDSVCAFNPYYGQGMSTAALSALLLRDTLSSHSRSRRTSRVFQRRLTRLLARPWLMATTEDCRYPETQGAVRDWRTSLNLWFSDRLIERSTHDATVRDTFHAVVHLIKPGTALMRPRIALPILLAPKASQAASPPRPQNTVSTN
jgi:2-polyprenyl-6-methoxyphenol hydroxylase-like FAD-dependent oxidoreductase